ncbi:MAG: zf-HC2 domain-containing protein [Acidimicrobiia bacterium]
MAGVSPMERHPIDDHLSLLLSCYLDGELSPGELDEVVAALESDLDAIAEFRALQAARRTVRTMPALNVPLELLPGSHLGEQLSAYLDGELVTTEMPAVVAHLDGCTDCRRELADLDRSRTAVRALPGVEPPAFLAIDPQNPDARAGRHKRRWLRAAVAVAAGVAAVSLAFAVTPLGDGTDPGRVSIVDLESRHSARASTGFVSTGLQIGTP